MIPREKENPFYSNHVFTEKDRQRVSLKLDLWERFCLLFRPTYVQLSEGLIFHYKTMGGRYYLIKEEPMLKMPETMLADNLINYK